MTKSSFFIHSFVLAKLLKQPVMSLPHHQNTSVTQTRVTGRASPSTRMRNINDQCAKGSRNNKRHSNSSPPPKKRNMHLIVNLVNMDIDSIIIFFIVIILINTNIYLILKKN